MKIQLVVIGKTTEKWVKEGIEKYFGRIKRYLTFEEKVIPDVKNAGKMTTEEIKRLEGNALLKNLENSDQVVLLDENGKTFSSREFSAVVEKQMIRGCRRLIFVIGGA